MRFATWQFVLVAVMAALCTVLGAIGPIGIFAMPLFWIPLVLTNALKPRKVIR